jgi:hypothetical protein
MPPVLISCLLCLIAGIATEIVSQFLAAPASMDIVTRKVARLCIRDLEGAQATGRCGNRLWCILSAFRDFSAADQQERRVQSLESVGFLQNKCMVLPVCHCVHEIIVARVLYVLFPLISMPPSTPRFQGSQRHTQDIEGTNRLFSVMSERAPSATLALLSSRITIKKKLGVGSSTSVPFHVLCSRAAELANTLVAQSAQPATVHRKCA